MGVAFLYNPDTMFKLKNKLNREECFKQLQKEGFERVTLSFYRYVPLKNLPDFRDALFREWDKLGVFGRVYIATEGINAQISVPKHNFEAFKAALDAREEFKNMFLNIAVEHNASFIKLTIKIRKQIVTDGLPENDYDLSNIGKHLSAEEFNKAIDDGALVVDMRNFYESRIGRFENAFCPDANTFKEELPMVVDSLKGKEDQKVVMYCTGGIRCEKASAYLKSKGFKDVSQLQGGIIHYAQEAKEKGIPSKFKGSNFVFDERIAERITDDVLAVCDQCDSSSDRYVNCRNATCNLLFIQCEGCTAKWDGCCSAECMKIYQMPEAERRAYYAAQPSTTYEIYKSRIRPSLKQEQ